MEKQINIKNEKNFQDLHKKYPQIFGMVFLNFLALESVCRLFIFSQSGKRWKECIKNIAGYEEGIEVNENIFNDACCLPKILKKYNKFVTLQEHKVDIHKIQRIRNSLAHARIRMTDEGSCFILPILYKFSKPSNGKVKVTHIFDMDKLEEQSEVVAKEIEKVLNALNANISIAKESDFQE